LSDFKSNRPRSHPAVADTTRTFVALEIPDPLGAKLAKLQERLESEVPGVRWTTGRPYHLTLAFLGDVVQTDLSAVCGAVAEASAAFEPLDLELLGLGVFPNPARPRVLWVGVTGEGLSALMELQSLLVSGIAEAGYRAEESRFHPHVTLGRIKPGGRAPTRNLGPLLERHRSWSAGDFTASEVVTVGSELTRTGPLYTPLSHAPLGMVP
jgi:2'-5' RNA ligase